MATKTKACGAVIYRKLQGRTVFLVLKHASGNHWALAKGHVEEGETEIETAQREILEETGLEVRFQSGFRETIRYSPSPGIDKTVVFFLAKAKKKSKVHLQKSEILNHAWLELADALLLVSHKDTGEVIKSAQRFLLEA